MAGSINIVITDPEAPEATEATALAYITMHTAAGVAPTLTADELTQLVTLAKRSDSEGRAPDDDEWEATWNLSYAILEGWRLKLAKATTMHNFSDGGITLNRQQVFENIQAMVDLWSRRVACSVTIPTDYKPIEEELSVSSDL